MASGMAGAAGPHLQTLFDAGTAAGLSDRELIERFLATGDARAGAESAFACLVGRHGPMVWRVCREVLRDEHEADDAFQAAFLVLARRAGSIRRVESVGPWLYGVALRVARAARRVAARRRDRERTGAEMRPEAESGGELDRLDAAPLLHEEVGRLAESERAAVVLCYFEGLTHEQAAGQLGWPVGTVRSRLARARDRLRSRLVRRGLAPGAAFLAASATSGSTAGVPAALAASTVVLAMRSAQAGAVPAGVAALAGRAMGVTTMAKLSMVATGLVAAGLVASAGVGLVAGQQGQDARPRDDAQAAPKPGAETQKVLIKPSGGQDFGKAFLKPEAGDIQARPSPIGIQSVPVPGQATAPGGPRDVPTATVGAGSNAPAVLWARLSVAVQNLQVARRLHETGEFDFTRVLVAKGEVDALVAELRARADDLGDEVELLKAQLAIRLAELDAATAQFDKADQVMESRSKLAKQNVISDTELRDSRAGVAIARAELAKRKAEVAEVQLRITQATRRRDEAAGFVKRAAELLAKSDPSPKSPAAALPQP